MTKEEKKEYDRLYRLRPGMLEKKRKKSKEYMQNRRKDANFRKLEKEKKRKERKERYANDLKYRKHINKNSKKYRDSPTYKKRRAMLQREKYKTNIEYRLQQNLRNRLRNAVKRDSKRNGSAVKDLGCSIEFFKKYLEIMWHMNPETGENMSWDNYGIKGWHIDHIIPITQFDLTNREQLLQACNYTNLQPLWFKENIRKGNK